MTVPAPVGMSGMAGHFSVPWAVHRRSFAGFLLAIKAADVVAPAKEQGEAPDYIKHGQDAVIQIKGVMLVDPPAWMKRSGVAHVDVRAVSRAVRRATADASVSRILLRFDSPGGMVSGTEELATTVGQANKDKPVLALIDGMCCSAAYWVAAQARSVRAVSSTCEIGSIGVYSVLTDVTAMYRDMGVSVTLVTSGPLKGAGADGRVTQPQVDAEQRIIDNLAKLFRGAIASGRGRDLGHLATGETWLADDAQLLGLIDATPRSAGPLVSHAELRALMAEHPGQERLIADVAARGTTLSGIRTQLSLAAARRAAVR